MSGFSLHEGVRMLGKSDLVFLLHRCWAYCPKVTLLIGMIYQSREIAVTLNQRFGVIFFYRVTFFPVVPP